MAAPLVYRPSLASLLISVLFFLASALTVYLCWVGINLASGIELMLLRVSSLFPLLMLIAATLRLVSVASRRILLMGSHLIHRQVFKNYIVPLEDIARIEARRGTDGDMDTIRILWSGTPFYIDARAISGFEAFVNALKERAPEAESAIVDEFSPVSS